MHYVYFSENSEALWDWEEINPACPFCKAKECFPSLIQFKVLFFLEKLILKFKHNMFHTVINVIAVCFISSK